MEKKWKLIGLVAVTVGAIVVMVYLWESKGPLPSRDEINGTVNELATALHQGQPLPEAIKRAVNRAANPRLKKAWEDVLNQVAQGRSLSRAMSAHRDVFPENLINSVLQGELNGNLDIALMRYISQ